MLVRKEKNVMLVCVSSLVLKAKQFVRIIALILTSQKNIVVRVKLHVILESVV